MKTQIIVIGAGIIGSITSYYLTSFGREVTLLDSSQACQEASGVNAGTLSLLVVPFRLLPLAHAGVNLWNSFEDEAGVDVGYHRIGGLKVALTEDERETLNIQKKILKRYGISIEEIDLDAFPYLSSSVLQANYLSIDGYADPLIAGVNILKKACEQGANFYPNTEVLSIQPDSQGGYRLETDDKTFYAEKVLVAAGIRSPKLLQELGVQLELIPRINQMVVTEKAPPLISHIVTHQRLTLKQSHRGSLLIGGGWQGHGSLDTNVKGVSAESMQGNTELARKIVPSLKNQIIIRSWSGFEGYTKDRMPVIGEIPGHRGAFMAITGYCGFTIGPAVALMAAEMML